MQRPMLCDCARGNSAGKYATGALEAEKIAIHIRQQGR